MSQAAYPTSAQVADFLESQGFDPAPAGMAYHVAEAIARWESRTGYKPFLGSSSSASWYFDGVKPGTDTLDLLGGFWTITSVSVNITATDDTGTALTINSDYIPLPLNAANDSRGWDRIRFITNVPSGFRCVKIVGKRGYAETIPDDVFGAIMQGAAALAMLEAIQGSSVEKMVQQGPVKIEFDTDAANSKIGIWNSNFDKAVTRYVRI